MRDSTTHDATPTSQRETHGPAPIRAHPGTNQRKTHGPAPNPAKNRGSCAGSSRV